MNQPYTPDNTRSSVIVVALLAAAVAVVAVLMGLSEKPQVDAIGIAAGEGSAPAVSTDFTFGDESDESAGTALGADPTPTTLGGFTDETGVLLDESGEPLADEATELAPTVPPAPTATPAVAAAVEPLPDQAVDAQGDAIAAGPTRVAPGTVGGSFFTRADEDEGAVVSRNEFTLTISEDGTGTFAGVLDMVMLDTTTVTLAVSGPLRWSTESPQIEAALAGTFELNSPSAAEDLSATEADLTITSITSGSGSLCAMTTTCFGLTFSGDAFK